MTGKQIVKHKTQGNEINQVIISGYAMRSRHVFLHKQGA
jgi:hypothetical protein